ncbi:MAG: hypothetical protein KJ814_07295 [Proteobacteria bacterium]|nr:hypothetical protein [Pseudomonadota bacterium]
MNLRKKLFDLSLESKGLYYRLPIIFALFFFVPLLGLLYFGLSYDFLGKSDIPVFILVLLGSSLAGYVMMRRVFDDILSTSARISKSLPQNLEGPGKAETSNELRGIVQSFQAVEKELRRSFTHWRKGRHNSPRSRNFPISATSPSTATTCLRSPWNAP